MSERAGPKRSLIYRAGKRLRPGVDRVVAAYSQVGDRPVFDASEFPWAAGLEAAWAAIRDEAAAVLGDLAAVPPLHDISPDHRRIAEPDRWRSFFLWGYGYRSDENCRRCPTTTRLVEAIPGLNSAFFSILKPGARIPPHRGVTKAILTCHLGLRIPARGRCEIRVGPGLHRWREGRCLIFDDTYEHEVWNQTSEVRVVLLVQFRRPTRQPGRLVGEVFLEGVRRSAFVQEARRNFYAWDGVEQALERDAARLASGARRG